MAILDCMGLVSDTDLAQARRLPEEYLSRSGEPEDRLIELINCHWGGYDAIARAQLAQALLPLLLDMTSRRDADVELYQGLCEGVVATWLRRQALENDRAG